MNLLTIQEARQLHRQRMATVKRQAEEILESYLERLAADNGYSLSDIEFVRKRERNGFAENQIDGNACAWCNRSASDRPMLEIGNGYPYLVICADPPCIKFKSADSSRW